MDSNDDCGNVATASQQVQVVDDSQPVLTNVPDDISVECDNIPPSESPSAEDNCDTELEISLTETIIEGECVDAYTIQREWTATDDCGNQSTATQFVFVNDTTSPILEGVPEDITAACDETPEIPEPGTVTATDNCDTDVDVVMTEDVVDNDCGQTISVLGQLPIIVAIVLLHLKPLVLVMMTHQFSPVQLMILL